MKHRHDAVDLLIEYVNSLEFSQLNTQTISAIKIFVLDSLGVSISGSRLPFSAKLITLNNQWGSGKEAQVWCTGEWLPAASAAMVNAWQLHSQEFDCIHEPAVVHPMAVIFPALMAFSQRQGNVSGKAFMTALSAAVDVATLLGEASNSALRFFRPATCGAMGATLGMAKLAGFSKEEMHDALGIIYSQISGTMQAHTEGSTMLPMQIAVNTRSALNAIDMCTAGMDAPHDVLEGPFGFFTLFEPEADLEKIFKQLGTVSQITKVSHKPFPTGRACHGGLGALMELQQKHTFEIDDIVQGELFAPPLIQHLTGRRPTNDMSTSYARLCFPYSAATLLIDGDVGVTCYDEIKLRDPFRLALAERFIVSIDDCQDPNAMVPQTLVLRLKDGRRLEQTQATTLGSPERPLSKEQHLAKFRQCCADGIQPLSNDSIETLINTAETMETLSDISLLTTLCTPSSKDQHS